MKKIILASNNKHKIEEIKQILNNYEVLSLSDIGFNDDIIENGLTFEENALIKAHAVKNFLKDNSAIIIADDSGLCVNALNGAPGIYSARYAGDHNDQNNRNKLLSELKDKQDRSAFFNCVIAVISGDEEMCVNGKVDGQILTEETGDTSFGYDCLFYSNELKKSFGVCTKEEKNSVSHRARALVKLKEFLNNKN